MNTTIKITGNKRIGLNKRGASHGHGIMKLL